MKDFDLIIIGAGPIGLACAIEAKKAGLNCRIIEKGCLVNSLYHYPSNMTFFSTSDKLEIGEVPFISHSPKPNRSEALEYYRRVCQTWKLDVNLYEEVISVKRLIQSLKSKPQKVNILQRPSCLLLGFMICPIC